MKKWVYLIWYIIVLAGAGVYFYATSSRQPIVQESVGPLFHEETIVLSDEPIQPVPLNIQLNPKKVELGNKLFHDKRLSKNGTVSCASCHDLSMGGTDQLDFSIGINGAKGDINSPTVFNSVFNIKQFWDGRADTLEDQVDGPITNAKEMGNEWPTVIESVKKDAQYVQAFKSLYADGITADNIKDAIATFERSLLTPNSRFDQYLRGQKDAITLVEKKGYQLFKEYGCASCHQGILAGGNMFQTMGKIRNYMEERGNIQKSDLGRFNVTGKERDKFKFKVPGLRNVERTAPYFHDGTAKTLDEAVKVMARYQLGRELPKADVENIVSFLKTLTGEYQGEPV